MLGRLLWLVALWLGLWGEVSAGNVVAGVLVATAVLAAFPPRPAERPGGFRPLAALRFLAYFLWKLVVASLVVAWEIVTPKNRINEGIVVVPIRDFSDPLTTIVANAVSLTPGTLTLEADREEDVLIVHVLHLFDVQDVRRQVERLELLAAKAFGNDEAIRVASAGATPEPEADPKGEGVMR
ncbi:MAG: Na+/H+ antiporter subunit E [Actinomycetota bacterium]|nr:Na+/H+ antiporter subunit E [Actinomycetota bacterium]